MKNNEEIFVTNPFGPPLHPKFSNYYRALTEYNIAVFFKNSAIVSFFSIVLGIFFVLLFTYVVARVRTKTTGVLRTVVVMGMFIPVQAIMTPLVVMVKNMKLSNTHWSLIVPYIALGFPFAVIVLYGFYVNLPTDLEESAYMDGSGFYRTYFQIILPLMKPPVLVLVIYQFMGNWNEFGLALVLITKSSLKTLPLGLASFTGQFSTEWGPVGASLVIASLPVIILYIFFSNKVEDAMAFSGMKN
ncbi:MAG TPA: carbohydrate ABC transporter permease [Ruminiclostridium sp.]